MKLKPSIFIFPLIFSLFSCKSESVFLIDGSSSQTSSSHEHNFANVVDEAYLAKEKDVFSGRAYYRSCGCGEVSNEVFYTSSPLSYQFASEENILSAEEFLQATQISLPSLLLPYFPVSNILKRTFLYKSVDQEGNRIVLSGAVTFPIDISTHEALVDGFIFDHHPTLTDYTESTYYSITKWSILALTGCCVIEIDERGNGISKDEPSIYHCQHFGNQNYLDGIYAAFSLLSTTYYVSSTNKKTYNVGYSQGGYEALSFLKYIETIKTSTNFNIAKTFAGSGAYNPATEFEFSLNTPWFPRPEIIIEALMSFEYYHPSQATYRTEDLLTKYGKKFIDTLTNKSLAELENIKQETDEYGNKLISSIYNVFVPELFEENNETRKLIIDLGEQESLIKDNWIPRGKCLLFYSEVDEIVTPLCSQQAIDVFSPAIRKNIEVLTVDNKNHVDSSVNFYLKTLLDIISDLNDLDLSILYNVVSRYL